MVKLAIRTHKSHSKLSLILSIPAFQVFCLIQEGLSSLEDPSKDSQRFVDANVLISAHDWPKRLSKFENFVETPFKFSF